LTSIASSKSTSNTKQTQQLKTDQSPNTSTEPSAFEGTVLWKDGELGSYPVGEFDGNGNFNAYNPKKMVVIGEGMNARVKPYARSFGAKWYQAWKQESYDPGVAMSRNVRWINGKTANNGYIIVDYGPKVSNNPQSDNYIMEGNKVYGPGYKVLRVPNWDD
jgi:hypothetical protein